jgi:CBS domain-containing protein
MPIIDHTGVLKGLTVKEAMRRQVVHLFQEAPIAAAIRATIKIKVNAVLVTDEKLMGLGVVSKTDLMGAYYAGLPLEAPVGHIMTGPPVFCSPRDSLDAALDLMRARGIHRLYVTEAAPQQAIGVLAYPDIVGLLYRFCKNCERNVMRRKGGGAAQFFADQYRMREVISAQPLARRDHDSLLQVMETLAAHRFGAVPLLDEDRRPVGVVSKTDLVAAYLHGVSSHTAAGAVMTSPVQGCEQEELLVTALQKMIFSDIHRLFIFKGSPSNLVGVFSLSDAARIRSGTCRACVTSRIEIG